MSKWSAIFQLKRSKVNATERQNLKKLPHILRTCLLMGGSAGGQAPTTN